LYGAVYTVFLILSEQRYRERYDRVIALRQQGLSIRAISRLTGLNRRTIIRLLNADSYPGVPTRGRSRRAVAGFEEYLRRRWHEGMRSVTGLLNEIRAQGYRGTYAALWGFVRALFIETPNVLTMAPSSRVPAEPSVRSTTWWLLGKSDRLTVEQRAWLEWSRLHGISDTLGSTWVSEIPRAMTRISSFAALSPDPALVPTAWRA
jgi:transposase